MFSIARTGVGSRKIIARLIKLRLEEAKEPHAVAALALRHSTLPARARLDTTGLPRRRNFCADGMSMAGNAR